MQGLFWVVALPYGFYRDGAELTDFDFGKISQFSPVPIKPSRQQITNRNALVDLDLGRTPDDVADARVGQQAQRAVV